MRRGTFIGLGILLLLVAAGFGLFSTTAYVSPQGPTYAPAGASCGFAIAGGLSIVAEAIAIRDGRNGG
jgi:hypothetical protein